jgi:hypothetical protein
MVQVSSPLPASTVGSSYNYVHHVDFHAAESLQLDVIIRSIPENFEGGSWRFEPMELKWDQTIKGVVSKIPGEDSGMLSIIIPNSVKDKTYVLSVDIFLCGQASCYKKCLKFLIDGTSETPDQIEISGDGESRRAISTLIFLIPADFFNN